MSIDLLVVDDQADPGAVVFFGGLPAAPAGALDWPVCATCDGPMQYQGRVPHPVDPANRVLVFQCANDPGGCDEWDPVSGGNKAIVIDASGLLSPAPAPDGGDTTLRGEWSGHVERVEADYAEAVSEKDGRQVLGFVGAAPWWIQNDETPDCPACGEPMTLAAQLEEGPDYRSAMNFGGGGCGYAFACGCPAGSAAFLWQCG